MNDHRLENGLHAIHNHNQHEPTCNERVMDALVSSESAHIQEFRLYRELSREIEKKNDRVRYVDSDIYQRSQQQDPRYSNPTSSTDVVNHVGLNQSSQLRASAGKGNRFQQSPSLTTKNQPTSTNRFIGDESSFNSDPAATGNQRQLNTNNDEVHRNHTLFQDGNCQVCLLKGLRDDLTHVTKVIQERNEQLLAELKAKRSRTVQQQRYD